MAFLRSDVLNKGFLEEVVRKIEGTKRVVVQTIVVGPCRGCICGSILQDLLVVDVAASVKRVPKEYKWIVQLLRSDRAVASLTPLAFERGRALMAKEVMFYTVLVPELGGLGAATPRTYPMVWGDTDTPEKEVIVLQRLEDFQPALDSCEDDDDADSGLDLIHVTLALEWLAKFHGLSYVLMRKAEVESGGGHYAVTYQKAHPWVRLQVGPDDDGLQQPLMDAKDWKKEMTRMASESIRAEAQKRLRTNRHGGGGVSDILTLVDRYDWLQQIKERITIPVQEGLEGFWTLCHGEPWFGNLSFRYDDKGGAAAPRGGLEGTTTKQKGANPAEAMFGGFHSYFIGKPGHDIALFLMTSTSRAFREEHLDHLLRAYLAELDDVIGSQGVAAGVYQLEELKRDYVHGLMTAVSFCVFVLPYLTKVCLDHHGQKQQQHSGGFDEIDGPVSVRSPECNVSRLEPMTPLATVRLFEGVQELLLSQLKYKGEPEGEGDADEVEQP